MLAKLQNAQVPRPPTGSTLIGREEEVAQLTALAGRQRVVTLTGPGGVGKTRLALEVASRLTDSHPDGIWLVDLAGLSDDAALVPEVARVVGIAEEAGVEVGATLIEALRSRSLVVVLDSCERQVPAVSQFLEDVVPACPEVVVIATSRHRLGVPGGLDWNLAPLPVPEGEMSGLAEAEESPAVRLFVDRAATVHRHFVLDEANAHAVSEVCRRLEGLPLAIELAAKQAHTLTPRQMLERLGDGLRLAGSDADARPSRHRTLRAVLDWSLGLLDPTERVVFTRLGAFAGSISPEGAEAVCGGEEVSAEDVVGVVARLIDKGLVSAGERSGRMQYWLLSTVRAYAAEQLTASGEGQTRLRHARWFLKWLEEGRDSTETGMGLWFDQVEAEQDNIRAALAWAMATSDGGTDELTLRLVGVLGPFWGARGHLSEGRRWTEAALTSRCPGESSDLRVRVGEILAGLAQAQGDHRQAGESLGEGLAHWRSRKDEVGVARCLAGLGLLARYRGDLAEADRLLSEALGCLGGAEGAADLGACLAQMGQLAAVRGQEARAAALYEEALAKLSVDGDAIGTADVLNQMGKLSVVRGEASMARSRCEEALAIHRENGHLPGVATSLELLGDVARMTDEFDLSATLNREALAIDRGLGDQRGIAKSLASLAQLAYQTGRHDQAGRLYQEVLELRRRLGDRRGEATALVGMANALLLDENRPPDLERARSLCEEALAIHRDVGDRRGAAWCLFSLAEICRDLEDYPAAKLAAEESLEIHRQLGDSALTTLALCSLGHLAHRRSDFETARDLAADATRMALALGKSLQIVRCVELVARVHCALGQAELSARLYGAAEAGRLSLGLAPPRPPERAILQGDLAALRSSLGLAATNEAMQAGRHLSILEGAALALSDERYQSVGANGKGPREVSGRPTWSLRLLGGVALYARGVPVEVGGKMPPKLFKVVALLGPLQVDEAVELLWPDAPPGMGRRRLHNVISRLNATCGAVIVRQGESLGLSSEVEVDARNFEQLAKAALVGGRGGRPQADVCRQALSLYHGELLPSDRYEDWTAWPRVRLAGLHLELLDALAVAAGNAGRLDEAVEWLEQAIQAEPLDDDRYRRAARLMVQQGWHNRARSLALRARRISEELGVPLSGELVDLLSDVAP